jgi:hypothetical protein
MPWKGSSVMDERLRFVARYRARRLQHPLSHAPAIFRAYRDPHVRLYARGGLTAKNSTTGGLARFHWVCNGRPGSGTQNLAL